MDPSASPAAAGHVLSATIQGVKRKHHHVISASIFFSLGRVGQSFFLQIG